jgi:hypothetical protein
MVFVYGRIGHCYLCAKLMRIYDHVSLEVVICFPVQFHIQDLT